MVDVAPVGRTAFDRLTGRLGKLVHDHSVQRDPRGYLWVRLTHFFSAAPQRFPQVVGERPAGTQPQLP